MNTVAIYTAIFGGFDTLKTHPDIPDVDFIVFTDDETLADRDDWRAVTTASSSNSRLAAKYPKIVGPQSSPLDRYKFTIWIDGSLEITSPTLIEALADLGPDGFAIYRHSYRDNIRDEAQLSVMMALGRYSFTSVKYAGQPILEQVQYYMSLGYADDAGLWGTGVLARVRSGRLDACMTDWMVENERWSVQDQISLPYVLWRHKIVPRELPGYPPGSMQDPNPWLEIHPHQETELTI